jgi:1-acyl-sn-glycerol-3-phosphate acyltransferase
MFRRTWLRRLVTLPGVTAALVVVLALFPLLGTVALVVDLARRARALGTTRLALFLLAFLVIEQRGLLRLARVGLATRAGSREREARTFAEQRRYTSALVAAVERVFGVRFEVEGGDLAATGPLVVFVRHASLVDVLLPGALIANAHGMELRYVLKRELLAMPCLDVAGHWIPNHFVDRSGASTDVELAALRALGRDLGPREGVVIFPEGTRYSARRREALLAKLGGDARLAAERLRHVLPIRRGGASALLDAGPPCDVLFVGHHGLEGLARLGDIWRGSLVGRTIRVTMWREPAASVPVGEAARAAWLEAKWQRLDDWLDGLERREAA